MLCAETHARASWPGPSPPPLGGEGPVPDSPPTPLGGGSKLKRRGLDPLCPQENLFSIKFLFASSCNLGPVLRLNPCYHCVHAQWYNGPPLSIQLDAWSSSFSSDKRRCKDKHACVVELSFETGRAHGPSPDVMVTWATIDLAGWANRGGSWAGLQPVAPRIGGGGWKGLDEAMEQEEQAKTAAL